MKGLQHAPCHVVVVHTEGFVTGGGEMMVGRDSVTRIGDIDGETNASESSRSSLPNA